MEKRRKRYSAVFKAKVALEAIKGQKTMAELPSRFGVHANQIGQWKKAVLAELPGVFSQKKRKVRETQSELEDELYRQIGQLKVELDRLKNSGLFD